MNAINHYVEVGQAWANGQVKIGQGLFEAIRGLEQFDAGLIWDKSVEACQAAIQGNLDAEVAGTRILFEEVAPVNNLPAAALDVVKQMQAATAEVAQTQQTAVDNWFNLLRQIDVKNLPLAGH
ncbi:MAG: hypothetical protein H6631_17930 [Anaerolineaceae bacterium]|nr:hypothetical protein [Anaerolineaceae bacterium]MCB9099788.1 hypothetical protein [Anaerolineales bacterium]